MRGLSIREIVRILLPRGTQKGRLLMLAGYFDDSGTHTGAAAVVMAGLIGTDEQWDAFDKKWKALLAAPLPGKPPLTAFHLVDCENRLGQFERYSRGAVDAITHDFRKVITESGLYSTATVIDGAAWDALVFGPRRIFLGSAEQQCFIGCIDRSLAWSRALPGDNQIALMFDRGRRTDTLEQIIELYKRRTEMYPELATITFGKVADFTPLQAADYVATETHWYAKKWLRLKDQAKARAHFADYMKTSAGGEGLYMDRATLAENLRRTQLITERPDGLGFIQMPPLPPRRS